MGKITALLIPVFYLLIIVPMGHGLAPLFLFLAPGIVEPWRTFGLLVVFSSLSLIVFSILIYQNLRIHILLFPSLSFIVIIINLIYIWWLVGMAWKISVISAIPLLGLIFLYLFCSLRKTNGERKGDTVRR